MTNRFSRALGLTRRGASLLARYGGALLVACLIVRLPLLYLAEWDRETAVDQARTARLLTPSVNRPYIGKREFPRATGHAMRCYAAAVAAVDCNSVDSSGLQAAVYWKTSAELMGTRQCLVRHDPTKGVEGSRSLIERLVSRNQGALRLVQQGAEVEYRLVYDTVPPLSPFENENTIGLVTNYLKARQTADILRARALLLHADGEDSRALDACRQALRFSDLVSSERILIGHMIGVAIVRSHVNAAAHVVKRGSPSLHQCRLLLAELGERCVLVDMLDSLRGETGVRSMVARRLVQGKATDFRWPFRSASASRVAGWMLAPLLVCEDASYLRRVTPLYRSIARASSPHQVLTAVRSYDGQPPRRCLLERECVVDYGAAFSRFLVVRAQCDLLMLRLAHRIEASKRSARPPRSLNDIPRSLVPDGRRIDPFDGSPYRCYMKDSLLCLYSVGPNGVDEGRKGDDIL